MSFVRTKAHGGKCALSDFICSVFSLESSRVSLVMPDPFAFQHRGHDSPVSSALSQTTEPIQLYCSKSYVCFHFPNLIWDLE